MKITDKAAIEAIIRRASVCRLALSDENRPYVIPLCFGYEKDRLYFHSARNGRKLDIIRKNDRVCFQLDVDVNIKKAAAPCNWDMAYSSVVGFGRAALVEDEAAKRLAFGLIMRQYSSQTFDFPAKAMEKTVVIQVSIDQMTGKTSGE